MTDGWRPPLAAAAEAWLRLMVRDCWQGGAFLLLVWLLCRAVRPLPPAVRFALWWAASLRMVLGLLGTLPIPIPLPLVHDYPASGPAAGGTGAGALVPALLFALWGTGVLAYLSVALFHARRVRGVLRSARAVEREGFAALTAELADRMNLRRVPEVVASPEAQGPLATGLLRPVIVLPTALTSGFLEPELRMVLAHELAHVRRNDLAWGLCPALAQALFFFHPLVRLACREFEAAREEACDAEAVALCGASPHRYGEVMVAIARVGGGGRSPAAVGATAGFALLRRRLNALQGPSSGRRPRVPALALAALAGGVGALPWSPTPAGGAGPAPAGVGVPWSAGEERQVTAETPESPAKPKTPAEPKPPSDPKPPTEPKASTKPVTIETSWPAETPERAETPAGGTERPWGEATPARPVAGPPGDGARETGGAPRAEKPALEAAPGRTHWEWVPGPPPRRVAVPGPAPAGAPGAGHSHSSGSAASSSRSSWSSESSP